MSYTVLARRYRSSTFDEIVGQERIAQTLKKAIESNRIAHAFLFCGTRGTGKTSMARILAKALNCQSAKGPTATPCGTCGSCVGIARGDDIDVLEIDAASNTKVEDTRSVILDNAQFCPARSRFKIFIIDEVHMLSKSSFNALLKTLEEPPEHVKFILATTEAEKVLPTIQSRCQRYDFRNIPTKDIAAHLAEICKLEKIKADDEALLLVARAGAGSMRDALSLLDRLLSLGEKSLTAEMVQELLGLPRAQLIFDLADAIGSGQADQALDRMDAMLTAGLSADTLMSAMVEHLRNLLIIRTCGLQSRLVEVPGMPPGELNTQAQKFDAVSLTQDIAILEELRRRMRGGHSGRALLDATIVRLTLAEQFSPIGELLNPPPASAGQSSTTRSAPAGQKKNDVGGVASVAGVVDPGSASPTPATENVEDDDDLPRPGKVFEGPSLAEAIKSMRSPPASPPPPAPEPIAPAAELEPVDPTDLSAVWSRTLHVLADKKSLHSLLKGGELIAIENGEAVVCYAASRASYVPLLEVNGKKELVKDALTRVLNQPVGLRFEVAAGIPEGSATAPAAGPATRPAAPAESAPSPAASRPTPEQIETLGKDPLIRAAMDQLSATVVKIVDT